MNFVKRIFLFLVINFLVVLTVSIILNLFHVQPYLNQYGIDYTSLMIFCLIWGMGGALISLAMSRMMAKWMMGVRTIDPNTRDPHEKELLSQIYTLSRKAGLSDMPEVGIFASPQVNAFATGPTKRRSLVAVSSALLEKMNHDQVEGVLAHEISHVVNGDMVTMTLIQGIVNAFVMFLARVLALVFSGFGRSDEGRRGSYGMYMLFVILFEVVFMFLGSLVVFWFSRQREFKADAGGAHLTGKNKMIGALEALKIALQKEPHIKEAAAIQTLKISTPTKTGLARLLSSHPPLEERIERLKQIR